MAAYNEEEGIKPTIVELKDILKDSQLIVVDGKSSDKTIEIAKDLGAQVFTQKGMGKGDAISEGLLHLNDETVYVIFTDADYTYPVGYVKEMINLLDTNPDVGMVLGNRFSEKYSDVSDRNQFYLGNKLLAFVHNILNGLTLDDPFTGLRIIRAELLKGWIPKSDGFDIEAEVNQHIGRSGYKIVEVPIKYRKRLGKKKLGFKHGLTILKRIITK
jgi:dolichol-phosphate mannosyltransferase